MNEEHFENENKKKNKRRRKSANEYTNNTEFRLGRDMIWIPKQRVKTQASTSSKEGKACACEKKKQTRRVRSGEEEDVDYEEIYLESDEGQIRRTANIRLEREKERDRKAQ